MQLCYVGNREVVLKSVLGDDHFYHLSTTILQEIAFEPAPQIIRNFNVRVPEVTMSSMDWHYTLGHAHFGALKLMAKNKDIVISGKKNQEMDCVSCIVGKTKRMSYNTHPNRSTASFDKVYVDLGFVSTLSLTKKDCFLTIVDEATRFVWTFALQDKSKAMKELKAFQQRIKTQFSKEIKVFMSDNGTEFLNKTMEELCAKSGAVHQTTSVYTPEENSLVEKMHFVLMGKVRALLAATGFPFFMWTECLYYVTFTNNRTACKALKQKTPYEALYKKKPDLSFLLPWGCIVMAYVVPEKRSDMKLSPRSIPTVFLGYAEGQKGYRVVILVDGYIKTVRKENSRAFPKYTVDSSVLEQIRINTLGPKTRCGIFLPTFLSEDSR